MRILLVLFTVATVALGQTPNPHRFTANDIRMDGDIAHLRGNVVMTTSSAVIRAGEASFDMRQYTIAINGDSRWNLLPVRASHDFNEDPYDIRPLADPARLTATEIKKNGHVTGLFGNVVMRMPGIVIYADDAEFNDADLSVVVHGNSRLVFVKAQIYPDDHLGPLRID